MSSPYYFDFLSAVWERFPDKDRERFAELWMGYEQVLAAIYQKQLELNLNIGVADLQPYATERWLPYSFASANFVERAAELISTQDLSVGVNLTKKHLLKIGFNKGSPIELSVAGAEPKTTTIFEIKDKINLVFGFPFCSLIFEDTVVKLASPTKGYLSSVEIYPTSNPELNACEFVLGVDPNDLPDEYPKYRYPYTMPYTKVAEIPELRDKIRDESYSVLLKENVDYVVEETGVISFKEVPLESMWAARTQTDTETPWYNYGFLTGIYQKNNARYVQVLQGLWFALWNGPKPANIKIALYLLFGLPVAPVISVATKVTSTEIEVTGNDGTVYPFAVPTGLDPAVSLGQSLYQFQPLVTGIDVFDKINYPGFIEAEIGREGIQRFLTEDATRGYGDTDETKALKMLEEYTFLPQISVETFVYPDINLGNVKIFLDAFRPLNKTYLFQVIVGSFRDLLGVTDRIGIHAYIDLTSNLDSNETTFMDEDTLLAYETTPMEGLDLDPHGVLFEERVEVEVRSFGVLTDSFVA